jgi:transcription antitermination factor NusG
MPDAQVTGPERTISCFVPGVSVPGAPWFCVYTKPQLERATEHRIRSLGVAAWLPLEAARLANRQSVIRPIFPRYLVTQAFPWPRVQDAGGNDMATILRSPTTGRPMAIPFDEMDNLFRQCAPNGVIYPPEPREVTRKDAVRVEVGPFTGFTGIVQRTTRERVWILLHLFGRQSEVPFTRQQVELIA